MKKGKLFTGLIMITLLMLVFSMTAVGQEDAGDQGEQEEQTEQVQPEMPQQEQEQVVVATIDDEEVYMSEVQQEAGIQQLMMQLQQQFPQFANSLFTTEEGNEFLMAFQREQLNNLITSKLLEREADKEEIELTDEYKDEFFQEQLEMMKQQYQMSEEEMLEALSQQGIESMDDFKDFMIEQEGDRLRERKLLEDVVVDKVGITEEDAQEFYDNNQQQYQQAEFDQVKDDIIMQLAREEYVEQLKDEADIEIMEEEFEGQPGAGGMMMP